MAAGEGGTVTSMCMPPAPSPALAHAKNPPLLRRKAYLKYEITFEV
jgi:hypothetical protein